ncbi:cytochrome b5 [Calliopsis andreniformis]|uniref:cytochrome b5 n=1 Tax=Calliopsis andreniformis TaxID=337506 RepID=UPI003FCEA9D2
MSKQFTRSEVAAANDSKNRTLLILHDKVYEVTKFLNEHPGGEEVLIDHGGIDGSVDFDDVGHSHDAFELMKKYLIGELVESERNNKPPKKSWPDNLAQRPPKTDGDHNSTLLIVAAVAVLAVMFYYMYM